MIIIHLSQTQAQTWKRASCLFGSNFSPTGFSCTNPCLPNTWSQLKYNSPKLDAFQKPSATASQSAGGPGACPWGIDSPAGPQQAPPLQPCSTHRQLQEDPENDGAVQLIALSKIHDWHTLQKPCMPKILASETCLFILFLRFSKSAKLLLYLSNTCANHSSKYMS